MVRKFCDFCSKDSYSSNDKGQWICPYCGSDLTQKPAEVKIISAIRYRGLKQDAV